MIDYLTHIRSESRRFAHALRSGDPTAEVPSCPDWTLADLGFHLAEVQYFWASIVDGLLEDPSEVAELPRPADSELASLFDEQSAQLVRTLTETSPDERCWTWHPDGTTVGWIRRRQAHEALIHRVDAELATDSPTPLDRELAVDGVDEVLCDLVGGYPDWATFEPDDVTVAVTLEDSDVSWLLTMGGMSGTSPNTGTTYDHLDGFTVSYPAGNADTIVTGTAENMDRWLWGRGHDIAIEGNERHATHVRHIAADGTQ